MPFFEPIPSPPEAPIELAPPSWVPASIDCQQVIARSAEHAITIEHVGATPDRLEFSIRATSKHRASPSRSHRHEEEVRVGFALSDGRRAAAIGHGGTVLRLRAAATEDDAEEEPVGLWPLGGGGSGHERTMRFRTTELPPAGPVTIVVEWVAGNIPETAIELDGTAIRSAGLAAEPIWPAS